MRTVKPSDVLRGLHDAIARSDVDSFCTALYLTAEADDDGVQVCMSAGGHHLPLRVDGEGAIEEVGRVGHLLGMLEPLQLNDESVTLAPGDALVLYTDGVSRRSRAPSCSARPACTPSSPSTAQPARRSSPMRWPPQPSPSRASTPATTSPSWCCGQERPASR